jgi:2-phospho-L-lactate transferase/gluconeogenesis factor (CofD/UPF0052 family)
VDGDVANTVRVAIFCGGRGGATIIREFLRWPNVKLTLLVNAYDDGLSTGALRNYIPGMLGPSDFRKNLSYLLDLYSDEQYAFKTLLEFRLPQEFGKAEETGLRRFVDSGDTAGLPSSLTQLIGDLSPASIERTRHILGVFLKYVDSAPQPFDFRDCAVGNLLFAGSYLDGGRNFNAAAGAMSRLVKAQADLVNVCAGEDRILVGLKADGQLLPREADIVGKQSAVPILETFFMRTPVTPDEWSAMAERTVDEKLAWLRARAAPTVLSPEARQTIEAADVIVYGPGTQHSSLLPSYSIASEALKSAEAPVKAYVVNLGPDNDIQGLSASDLVDRALKYAGDPENRAPAITHILLNEAGDEAKGLRLDPSKLSADGRYRNAVIVKRDFAAGVARKTHNGNVVVREILRLWESGGEVAANPSVEIFLDLYRRSVAIPTLLEEFQEINWLRDFSQVSLRVEGEAPLKLDAPPSITAENVQHGGPFPEVLEVLDWLNRRGSDYLVTITGDGEYRFRDVRNCIIALRDSEFGAIYGSRTQSRNQFNSSVRAAYGERGIMRLVSSLGAFLLTVLYSVRFQVIFSDPLTGFRVYRRRYVQPLKKLGSGEHATPTSITKCLIEHQIEIAELPVRYRTFAGFTNPRWRFHRGLLNLYGLVRRV